MLKIPLEILFRLDEKMTNSPLEASYSNQCWQLNITPSELHRLPSQVSNDPRRLMVYSVVDDKSGLSYSRYYLAEGEDTLTALDFLYHAFSKMMIAVRNMRHH